MFVSYMLISMTEHRATQKRPQTCGEWLALQADEPYSPDCFYSTQIFREPTLSFAGRWISPDEIPSPSPLLSAKLLLHMYKVLFFFCQELNPLNRKELLNIHVGVIFYKLEHTHQGCRHRWVENILKHKHIFITEYYTHMWMIYSDVQLFFYIFFVKV